MPADMTPDEIAFFESGELPPALEAEHTAALEAAPQEPVIQDKVIIDVPEVQLDAPAPAPALDLAALERMFDAKIDALRTQLAPPVPKQQETEAPDENIDPLGNMMHKLNKLTDFMTQQSATTQQLAQRQQLMDFTAQVQAQKAAFEKTTPDFSAAYDHMRALRAADLDLYGASTKDINQIMLQDELQLAAKAIERGKNPAEEMYNMAKRYGYVPKAATTPATTTTPEQKIAHIKDSQPAAKHVDKTSPADPELTLEGLTDVSNRDLNKLIADPKAWANIVGGSTSDDLFN